MRANRQLLHWRPFQELEDLSTVPDDRSAPFTPEPERDDPGTHQDDSELFRQAMEDVVPLDDREDRTAMQPAFSGRDGKMSAHEDEREAFESLRDLVRGGKGFSVAHTPEYMEGRPYRDVHGVITEQLHRGRYAIQGHIDLHGMTLERAEQALEEFFARTVKQGHRMVLVIHGRGKSSPVRPVLKSMFREWLTKGPFRAWIIAFASARLCDGGAGATYVLLRRRPLTKSKKRGSRPTGGIS